MAPGRSAVFRGVIVTIIALLGRIHLEQAIPGFGLKFILIGRGALSVLLVFSLLDAEQQ